MDVAMQLRITTTPTKAPQCGFAGQAVTTTVVWGESAEALPATRLDLWARCWQRIRTWRLPPLWAARDWYEEAHAQGALAEYLARRDFDPSRSVPLDAFLYRRIVHAVWTRYRQEWSFGRRAIPQEVARTDALDRPRPDPALCEHMTHALKRLSEEDRRLICRLFWDGSTLEELSGETGLRRDALKKRKARALLKLREILQEAN